MRELILERGTDTCAQCGMELRELDFFTDSEHPSCHRVCDAECLAHYSTLYPGKGWMVTR